MKKDEQAGYISENITKRGVPKNRVEDPGLILLPGIGCNIREQTG